MTSHTSHWQGTASHVLWAQGLARADLPSKRLRCVRGEQRHLRALSTPPLPAPPRGSLPCLRLSCPRRFQVGTASFLCSPRGVPHHHAEGLAEGGAQGCGCRARRAGADGAAGPRLESGAGAQPQPGPGQLCGGPAPQPRFLRLRTSRLRAGPWAQDGRSPRGDSTSRLQTEDEHSVPGGPGDLAGAATLCPAWVSQGPAVLRGLPKHQMQFIKKSFVKY